MKMAKKNKMYFEVTAMGDVIHFEAESLKDAQEQYTFAMGEMIPFNHPVVTWKELPTKPKGVTFMPPIPDFLRNG